MCNSLDEDGNTDGPPKGLSATGEVRQIAEIESSTLFLTNLGQLIAFDPEAAHFCRRAISLAKDTAFVLHRASPSGDSRRAQLIVERKARGQYYKLDMGGFANAQP
jgi:hypothetical protein